MTNYGKVGMYKPALFYLLNRKQVGLGKQRIGFGGRSNSFVADER